LEHVAFYLKSRNRRPCWYRAEVSLTAMVKATSDSTLARRKHRSARATRWP